MTEPIILAIFTLMGMLVGGGLVLLGMIAGSIKAIGQRAADDDGLPRRRRFDPGPPPNQGSGGHR